MSLYFEAHVTIEPVFDERLEQFKKIAEKHFFRVADLLMQKRLNEEPVRSKFDSFCTSRHPRYDKLEERVINLIFDLKSAGFVIWRYKIEDTILDSNISDELKLLKNGCN